MLNVLGTSFLCLCCFACFSTLLQHEKFKIKDLYLQSKPFYENLLKKLSEIKSQRLPPMMGRSTK